MTEAEWLGCDDPARMILFLGPRLSVRKLRLFGCACCRRLWHLLPDERSRAAIKAAERHADGDEDAGALLVARAGAHDVFRHWKCEEYSAEVKANFGETPEYVEVCARLFAAAAARAVVSRRPDQEFELLDAYQPAE